MSMKLQLSGIAACWTSDPIGTGSCHGIASDRPPTAAVDLKSQAAAHVWFI